MPATRPAFAASWSPTATCSTTRLTQAYGKMDAVKIDLKSFSESYYAKVVTGQLKPVLESLVTLRKMGKWTEIVYLVVPTLNDGEAEFRGLAHGSRPISALTSRSTSRSFIPSTCSRTCPSRRCRHWSAPKPSPMPRACITSTSATSPAIRRKTLIARSAAKCWSNASALPPARCSSAKTRRARSAGIPSPESGTRKRAQEGEPMNRKRRTIMAWLVAPLVALLSPRLCGTSAPLGALLSSKKSAPPRLRARSIRPTLKRSRR